MSQLALPIEVGAQVPEALAAEFSAAEWTCLAGDACQGFIPVDDHQTIFCPFHAPPEYRPVRIVQRRKGRGRIVTHVRDGDEWVAVPPEFDLEDLEPEFDDEDNW